MKIQTIKAVTINDLWFQAMSLLLNLGSKTNLTYIIEEGSYIGQKRLEYDFLSFQITFPETRPFIVMPETIKTPPPFDNEFLEQYLNYIITTYKPKNTIYTYGERLFSDLGNFINLEKGEIQSDIKYEIFKNRKTNQIQNVIKKLKKTKNTNQCCTTIGIPSDIILNDPPCCRIIDFNMKGNRLNMFLYFRSWDLWGGLPLNLAAFQILKEMMADELNVSPGQTFASSKGLHLYDHCWEVAKILTHKEQNFKIIGE